MSVEFGIGVLVGVIVMRVLTWWTAMWRVCCREHYGTHATCLCRDCTRDREMDKNEQTLLR